MPPPRRQRPSRPKRPTRSAVADSPKQRNKVQLALLASQPPRRPYIPPHPDGVANRYAHRLAQVAAKAFDAVRPLIALLTRYQAQADAAIESRADDRGDPEDEDAPTPHRPSPKGQSPDDLRVVAQNRKHERTASGAIVQPLFLPSEIATEVEIMRKRLTIYRDNLPVDGIAGQAADMLEKWHVGIDLRMTQSLGLNPIRDGSALAKARDTWVKTNAALITSQPQEVAERVAAHIHEMVPQGARWETIAKRLEDEEGIAHRRAALIARDQVSKYNADLTRTQMQACGIEHYQWRGAMDNRERPTHVALEGTIWAFDKPPPIGNPGEPIRCRCSAIPVTSDQQKRQAGTVTEADLLERTIALGPTQKEGADASPEQIRVRATADLKSEIRLSQRREAVQQP